jgi:hypothetical protein
LIIGLALLAGCGARPVASPSEVIPTATSPTTPRPTQPKCSTEGVRFSLTGADAAMGLRVLTIEMVNCGTSPYTVNGYPSLRMFDKEYQPIDVVVGHGSASISIMPDFDVPPREIILQPGEKAMAGLLWRNLVTDATVNAATAYYLDAAPAADKPWQPVPMVVPNEVTGTSTVDIDLGNTGKLGVQAWTKA